jgi:hypothetical protein
VIASGGNTAAAEAAASSFIWRVRGTDLLLSPAPMPIAPDMGPDLIVSVQMPWTHLSADDQASIVRLNSVLMACSGCCLVGTDDGVFHALGVSNRAMLKKGALRHLAEGVVAAATLALQTVQVAEPAPTTAHAGI